MVRAKGLANRMQYPLSTVSVRWHNQSYFSMTHNIHKALGPYGQIVNIVVTGENSANIVFTNLPDACKVVRERLIGSPQTRLFCYWYHRNLAVKVQMLQKKDE